MLRGLEIVALLGLAMFTSTSCDYYDENDDDKFDNPDTELTGQLDEYYTDRNPFLPYRHSKDMAAYTELLPEMLPNYYVKDLRASVMTTETDETVPEFMLDILSNFDSIKLKRPSRKTSDHITKAYDDSEYDGQKFYTGEEFYTDKEFDTDPETTIRWVVFPRREEDKWFYFKNPTTLVSSKSEKPTDLTVATDSTEMYQFITSDTPETKTFVNIPNESENPDPTDATEPPEKYQFITSKEYPDTNDSVKPHPTVLRDSTENYQYSIFHENLGTEIIIVTENITEKKKPIIIPILKNLVESDKSKTIVSLTRTQSGVKNRPTNTNNLQNKSVKLLFNKINLKEKPVFEAIDGYRINSTPKKFRYLKEKKKHKPIDSDQKKLRDLKNSQHNKSINKFRISKFPNEFKKLKDIKRNSAINGYRISKNKKKFRNLRRKKEFKSFNVYPITRTPNKITRTSDQAYTRKKKENSIQAISPQFTRTVEYQITTPVRTKTRDKVGDYSTTLTKKKKYYDKPQASAVYREHEESWLSREMNTTTPTLTFGTEKVVTRTQFEPVSIKNTNTVPPTLSFGTAEVITKMQFEPVSSENTNTETSILTFDSTEAVSTTQIKPVLSKTTDTVTPTLSFSTPKVVTRTQFQSMSSKTTGTETLNLNFDTTETVARTHFEPMFNKEIITETLIATIDETAEVSNQRTLMFSEMPYTNSRNPNVIIVPLNYPENPSIKPDNIESASVIPTLDTLFTETESVFDDRKIHLVTEQWMGDRRSDPNTDIDIDSITWSEPTSTDYSTNDDATSSLTIPFTMTDYFNINGTTPSLISQSTPNGDLDVDGTTPTIISQSTQIDDSDNDRTTPNLISESITFFDTDDNGTTLNLISESLTIVDSDHGGTTSDFITELIPIVDSDDGGTSSDFITELITIVDSDDDGNSSDFITELITIVDSDDDGNSSDFTTELVTTDNSKNVSTTPILKSHSKSTDKLNNDITPSAISQSSKDISIEDSTDLIKEFQFEAFTVDPNFEAITTAQTTTKVKTSIIPSSVRNTTSPSAKSPLRQGEAYWEAKILQGQSFRTLDFAISRQLGPVPDIVVNDVVNDLTSGHTAQTRPNRNPARVDINKLLARIRNMIEGKGDPNTLYQRLNDSFQRKGIPTVDFDTTTLSANLTGTIMGKCFVCGLDQDAIPRNASCGDAFAGDFIPLVPVDPTARSQIHKYRKYCRWKDMPKYQDFGDRNTWGRWTGGCSVRWIDLSGQYTERSCRNRHRSTLGKSFASKRMAKLEMALQHLDDGCIMSPVASLIPMSRGISLYARFFACVCTGSWCNRAVHFVLHSPHVAVFTILGLTLQYFVGIG